MLQVGSLTPEKAIPDAILRHVNGLAILTIVKVGMMVTYKIGTGLVIARREDGLWSPPMLYHFLALDGVLRMSVEERFRIVRSVGEECIQEELLNLLTKKPQPICYDGFEPSGRMHIAQGVMKTLSVNKLVSVGCKVKIWIADWFAFLNDKMGGDLNKIQTVGLYLIEIWKAAGMNLEGGQVEFLWSSEEINSRAHEYWPLVVDIAMRNKLPRITRCCQVMGRKEQDGFTAAQIFCPYMFPGLLKGQEKMSKCNPSSAIFMEDEEDEVNSKINNAYCPPNVVGGNACLEYLKYIVFPWFNEFKVESKTKNGREK
ncbi:hypothetical protein L1987_20981 [Smallanthus sonchifolius]|uniref:Uncharacterized protein n=1 Tax=Smallanthus sonchifolius TaxID=185202 RepID=A0ACB9ITU3_9ASTR|nr:hypothetical protein L1987_20981 [Smallanthus sonchifolius]